MTGTLYRQHSNPNKLNMVTEDSKRDELEISYQNSKNKEKPEQLTSKLEE